MKKGGHPPAPPRAYLDLGSNLERKRSLRAAIHALRSEFSLVATSSVYESPPYPPGSTQPYFYNMAVALETDLEPEEMRARLRALESYLGRVRSEDKFAARTIDLDLTLLGDYVHEHVATQPFVLIPLAEIAGNEVHPELGKPLRELALELPREGLVKVEFTPDE